MYQFSWQRCQKVGCSGPSHGRVVVEAVLLSLQGGGIRAVGEGGKGTEEGREGVSAADIISIMCFGQIFFILF